jgi:uncharacterized repeat protein (TIGR01451 family)
MVVSSVPASLPAVLRGGVAAASSPAPSPHSTSPAFSGNALPAGLESWVLVTVVGIAMVLAMVALLLYGLLNKSYGKQEGNSVVRAWIAVSLVAGVIILTAATLGGTDTGLQNVLIGSLVAGSGSAVAFYFATKSAESANAAVLKAAGIGAAADAKTLLLSKTADPTQIPGATAGSPITFHFKVTNTGKVPLTGVHISDSLAPPASTDYVWPGKPGELAPGAVMTATSRVVITPDDIRNGAVTASATATGTPASGDPLDSEREWTTTKLA